MVLKVRYRGSPSSVGVFGSLLRDEGLRVEHREIPERHVPQDIVDVVFYVDDSVENGAPGASSEALITPQIEAAISKLRMSVPRAQAQIVARPLSRT
jgi:hypothetical protein